MSSTESSSQLEASHRGPVMRHRHGLAPMPRRRRSHRNLKAGAPGRREDGDPLDWVADLDDGHDG